MKTRTEILRTLKEEIARETGLQDSEIDDDASFFSLGLDSISSVYIMDKVEKRTGIEMNPLFFWDYPTVSLLAEHLSYLSHDE